MKRGVKPAVSDSERLAREMVLLDKQIALAVKDRRFLDAFDLEQTRWVVMDNRSALMRRAWQERWAQA